MFAGPRIIAVCDRISVRRFIGAPNAEVVRRRKTGEIMQVNLESHGDDSALQSLASDASPTYNEQLAVHTVLVLKKYDPDEGRLVRWSDDDSFSPRRFNPDLLETLRAPEPQEPKHPAQITARLSDAPRMPIARFSVKRDPALPWSAANSRAIY